MQPQTKTIFSNNQMVNTRSGAGGEGSGSRSSRQPRDPRPRPGPNPAHGMEPLPLAELLTNLTNVVHNIHTEQQQQNPPHPAVQHQQWDRYRDFLSLHPPAFSHSAEPLDADDWLKAISKKLNLVPCTDHERALYASSKLEGTATNWWDAYVAAHANPDGITWNEFCDSFRTRFIPTAS